MYEKFHRLWIKALIANVIIIIAGFVTGIATGDFSFFMMIAAFGMTLEFALPYLLIFTSNKENSKSKEDDDESRN